MVEAHKWAITQHPDSYGLYITDYWYDEYGRRGDTTRQNEILTWYDDLQQQSEQVLVEYHSRAGLPLPLGGNVIRKDIPLSIQRDLLAIMRESIDYGLAHRDDVRTFVDLNDADEKRI